MRYFLYYIKIYIFFIDKLYNVIIINNIINIEYEHFFPSRPKRTI